MATHSSIPPWEIPWTEEPDGLQSTGSQKSWNYLATKEQHIHTYIYIHIYIYISQRETKFSYKNRNPAIWDNTNEFGVY